MAISLTLFIVVILIASIVRFILAILGFIGFFGVLLMPTVLPLIILNGVLSAFLHYTCWNALPAGYRKNVPLTTSLLLLVPIFNLYWCFVTFPNLGRGFDQCQSSNRLDAGMRKETLGTLYACAVLASVVTSWIPFISGLVSLVALLLFLLFYIEVIKAAGAIAKMQDQLITQPVYEFAGVGGLGSSGPRYVEQPGTPMQKLLRLAKHHNGELSMAQMTMDTHFSKEELKSLLHEAQRDGFVEIVNHPETGAVRYKFDVD